MTITDNIVGMWMCRTLIKAPLRAKERRFVQDLMRRLLTNPETFTLTEKQRDWLGDLWHKKGKGNDPYRKTT
jgi:hypothetical protein